MKLHIENFHFHDCPECDEVLKVVKRQELLIGRIMLKLDELGPKLAEIKAAQDEAFAEVSEKITGLNASVEALQTNVAQLQEQLAQQGNPELPAETIALLDDISLKARELADIVPNPEPAPEPVA